MRRPAARAPVAFALRSMEPPEAETRRTKNEAVRCAVKLTVLMATTLGAGVTSLTALPITGGTAPRSTSRLALERTSWPAMRSAASSTSRSSTATIESSPPRAKTRRSFTRLTTRCVPHQMSASSSLTVLRAPASKSSRSMSFWAAPTPSTSAAIGLLISCATPAARVPSATSRSFCATFAQPRERSVTSRKRAPPEPPSSRWPSPSTPRALRLRRRAAGGTPGGRRALGPRAPRGCARARRPAPRA